ncbi:hypothetical protein FZC76_21730 [Sutcliffiella horikoshii]|uniref:Uncharacterized protein n=1 Tax=Sutcliffiella horikoshii TaxID=79883 RepID=A0A5D4SEF4_9BACI|nr:hypothetical protein [Sutcliffiella horikoshii]TYS60494.1 hypothetical protein FZC76_21730 [Sutcliffiella horikoshii]
MNRDQAYELERLLSELEKYDYTFIKPKITRVKEIVQPIIINEKEKESKDRLKLKFSYNKFTPSTEVQRAIGALSNSIAFYEEAGRDIATIQRKQQDILHALELTDLDDVKLNELMKELQEIRILRRVAKNFQEALEPLYHYATKNRHIVKELGRIHNEIMLLQKNIADKKYHVREKTALAEAFENAEELSNRVEKLTLVKE